VIDTFAVIMDATDSTMSEKLWRQPIQLRLVEIDPREARPPDGLPDTHCSGCPRHRSLYWRAGSPSWAVLVSLFEPGVTAMVVSVPFPEAIRRAVEQVDLVQPFHALPQVAVWHEQSKRPSVVCW
jgi:hypothetical protein